MTETTTLYEWVNPAEFTPENGWVQDMIDSGRLRERTFRRPDWYGDRPGGDATEPLSMWVEVTDE